MHQPWRQEQTGGNVNSVFLQDSFLLSSFQLHFNDVLQSILKIQKKKKSSYITIT